MWCMRSPSVAVCLFISAVRFLVYPILRCVVSELLFPATVAILLIGLRNLYHVYDCGLCNKLMCYDIVCYVIKIVGPYLAILDSWVCSVM
jgi:hypothetical protein